MAAHFELLQDLNSQVHSLDSVTRHDLRTRLHEAGMSKMDIKKYLRAREQVVSGKYLLLELHDKLEKGTPATRKAGQTAGIE
jgi:hypothetical protein